MITYTNTIPDFYSYADFYGFSPEECLFFDIETTGLSSSSSSVFLIGIISYSENEWKLTQWMTQNPQEEPLLLETFLTAAIMKKTLIHFNGTAFDIPFILERIRRWKLSSLYDFEAMQSVDLYQKFKPLKKLYHLDKMTQQSLEQFIGWIRTDKLTGRHMIDLYKKYSASQEPLISDLLLLHNHDDLLGMIQLLPLSNVLMLMHGYIIDNAKDINTVIDQEQNTCSFHFPLCTILPAPLNQDGALDVCTYHIELSKTTGTFQLQIHSGELRYYFPDYKNYYYLPAEDQAIHKSIGAFVDRDHRQNAKPHTCYTRKAGAFLPQISSVFQPCFKKQWDDHIHYFEIAEDFLSDQINIKQYLNQTISHLLFHTKK